MSDHAVFLLVEDSADDAMLIRRAFAKSRVLNPVHVAQSVEEAIAYLSGEGRFRNREEFPLPALLLLDLNSPSMDGLELLRWIRRQPGLNPLRVVVLASPDSMRDVNQAYQLGANSFLVKPVDFERFVEISQALSGYWLWLDRSSDVSRQHVLPQSEQESRPG
jgi:CheY-like chemotaxis protein